MLVKIRKCEAVLNIAVLCNGFKVAGNCRHIRGNLCVGVWSFSVRNLQVKPPSLLKCIVNSDITMLLTFISIFGCVHRKHSAQVSGGKKAVFHLRFWACNSFTQVNKISVLTSQRSHSVSTAKTSGVTSFGEIVGVYRQNNKNSLIHYVKQRKCFASQQVVRIVTTRF